MKKTICDICQKDITNYYQATIVLDFICVIKDKEHSGHELRPGPYQLCPICFEENVGRKIIY